VTNKQTIVRIPIEMLFAHPENPNRMSRANFAKLKKHIQTAGNYEPVVVRQHPEIEQGFEIINGHHRVKALDQLGADFADCIEWDVDDDQARVLLASLNRLTGKDTLRAKVSLFKNLSEKYSARELAKLLPESKANIEKLKDITRPDETAARDSKAFLHTMIFLLDDDQIKTVSRAIEKAAQQPGHKKKNTTGKAKKMAKAITGICREFLREK